MDQLLCAFLFSHPLLVYCIVDMLMLMCDTERSIVGSTVKLYGHRLQQSMDQPGMVVNLASGQLNRENDISLSPFAPENLVSRDGFARPVPRQPAHSPHSA